MIAEMMPEPCDTATPEPAVVVRQGMLGADLARIKNVEITGEWL
ncbi:hypothetical protein [Streptomyces sp. NPDC007205]